MSARLLLASQHTVVMVQPPQRIRLAPRPAHSLPSGSRTRYIVRKRADASRPRRNRRWPFAWTGACWSRSQPSSLPVSDAIGKRCSVRTVMAPNCDACTARKGAWRASRVGALARALQHAPRTARRTTSRCRRQSPGPAAGSKSGVATSVRASSLSRTTRLSSTRGVGQVVRASSSVASGNSTSAR